MSELNNYKNESSLFRLVGNQVRCKPSSVFIKPNNEKDKKEEEKEFRGLKHETHLFKLVGAQVRYNPSSVWTKPNSETEDEEREKGKEGKL